MRVKSWWIENLRLFFSTIWEICFCVWRKKLFNVTLIWECQIFIKSRKRVCSWYNHLLNNEKKDETKELNTVSNLNKSLCIKKSSTRYICSKTENRCFSYIYLKVSLSAHLKRHLKKSFFLIFFASDEHNNSIFDW